MKLFKLGTFLFLTFLAMMISINSAHAYALDNWTANLSAAAAADGGTQTDITGIDEMGVFGNTLIVFDDNDGSNTITAGDTFNDYFAIRIEDFTSAGFADLTPTNYGSQATHEQEITVLGHVTGIQTTDNTYALTNLIRFDVYYDSIDDSSTVGSFTGSDFTDLSTFDDGVRVETGDLVFGGGVNTGPTNISGTFDMVVDLNDLLHLIDPLNEFFELDQFGNPLPMELVMGIVDSNNTSNANVDTNAFETEFGPGILPGANQFAFTAINDGSVNKAVVPEPTTMILFGIGLLGVANISRRKKD